jgi:hypothetical protein
MRPCNEIFAWNSGEVDARVMADPGRLYAVYFYQNHDGTTHGLSLPQGEYRLEWIDPTACRVFLSETKVNPGVYWQVATPSLTGDLALKLSKIG